MAAPRGSYNAREFHEERERELSEKLSNALAAARRSGQRFANVSALSAHIARDTGQTAGNLRRNKRSRAMMETFLANQKGAAGLLASGIADVNVLRTQLLQAKLDASNALRDRRRLEMRLASLEQSQEAQAAVRRPFKTDGATTETAADLRMAFECTAQALHSVIEHIGYIETNLETMTLRDRAARPGSETIVTERYLKYYVGWLKKRPSKKQAEAQ